ncbi:MAG: FixH family protein [Flavobacteriales bacterium]|nr:FixH family protein [Flavobacteriales bacterium]
MKWNWGYGITAAMLLFVAMMAGYMVWAAREQEELVSKDYYGEEKLYQQHLEQARRAQALPEPPKVAVESGRLAVFVPPAAWSSDASASLRLFRPSDQRADRTFPVRPDQHGSWSVDISGLLRGAYKAQLQWTSAGVEYYLEEPVYLP